MKKASLKLTNSDIVYPNLIIKDPVFVINIYRSLKGSLIMDLKVGLGLIGGHGRRETSFKFDWLFTFSQ